MKAWTGIGNLIGSNMAILAPACLVLGVLFPDAFSWITPHVTVMFAFITFQGALGNNFSNLAETVRHPLPMVLSLLVSAVIMPVLVFLLGGIFFGSDPDIMCGLVLEYAVPVAVLSVMWTGLFQGNLSLTLATLLVSTVASPLTIPLTLKLLLGQTVQVDVAGMMFSMLVSIALPACAGMAVNDLSHGWGKKTLSPAVAPAARILMIMVLLSNSTEVSSYVHNLTPMLVGVVVFIGLFASTGYVWGMVLARLTHQPRGSLISMTYLCGMRNISAGAVIAASYFPGEAMYPVIMGTLFQQVLAALFSEVTKRVAGEPEPEADEKPLPAPSRASAR